MDYLLALHAPLYLFNITDTLSTCKTVKCGYKTGVLYMWVENFLFSKIVQNCDSIWLNSVSICTIIYLLIYFWKNV